MKKLKILTAIFIVAISALLLTACSKSEHSHSFTQEISEEEYLASPATCTQAAAYYYTCKCGKIGTATFYYGNPLGHSFGDWSYNETEHWRAATCGHDVEIERAQHNFDKNKKCTFCNYITTKPLRLELQSETFKIDLAKETAYLKVSNSVNDYDFSDKFMVADGARFDICTDKECNNKIASKKTNIVVGDNIFYVLVTNGNDVKS